MTNSVARETTPISCRRSQTKSRKIVQELGVYEASDCDKSNEYERKSRSRRGWNYEFRELIEFVGFVELMELVEFMELIELRVAK